MTATETMAASRTLLVMATQLSSAIDTRNVTHYQGEDVVVIRKSALEEMEIICTTLSQYLNNHAFELSVKEAANDPRTT